MLKTFLVRIRRKPKVIRDQYALAFAGILTFVVAAFWIFTALPGYFSGFSDAKAPDLISTLKEDAPDFKEVGEEFQSIIASSSIAAEESETIIPNEYPASSTSEWNEYERPVRIATTSNENSSTTETVQ